jgi:predicted GH43/DUF377 family glycosyl hydrolase
MTLSTPITLTDVQQPNIPGNDFSTMQKNWVPFECKGNLYFIYKCHPTHQVFEVLTGKFFSTPILNWPYGEIRGGSVPVSFNGGLLRFFHSRLNNENFGSVRYRYFIGAYVMQPEPPFTVLQVGKKPIIYGSEIGTLRGGARKACDFYKPNVVFPGGVIVKDGKFILAFGVNDAEITLVKITPGMLNL